MDTGEADTEGNAACRGEGVVASQLWASVISSVVDSAMPTTVAGT